MSTKADSSHLMPREKPGPVCLHGQFVFAAAFLDHGHINGMCRGLSEAGGVLRWVYDADRARAEKLAQQFPGANVAESFQQILDDASVHLVASAAVPCDRGPVGVRVMKAGKDYFVDKAPFTSLAQLDEARRVAKETSRKYAVYYGERLHSEAGVWAGELIRRGVIGRVVQIIGLGPHRIGKPESRPPWFFQKQKYGGILCDIASHQCEQFLSYAGATDAAVNFARVDNVAHPQFPELEDFGEASFTTDTGASCYCRVDWLTPTGLRTWGDGRTFILGTEGYIEARKYVDVATDGPPELLIVVDKTGEHRVPCKDKVGYPFFGQLILDCLQRTENAMTQHHAFKAAEMSLKAQDLADRARRR